MCLTLFITALCGQSCRYPHFTNEAQRGCDLLEVVVLFSR